MAKATTTYDFSKTTVSALLEDLRCLATDGLPTDSPHAQTLKGELTRRGVPLAVTDGLLAMAREVQRAGARVSFGHNERAPQILALVTFKEVL